MNKAFTLIELMVVIVIIGIMAIIAAPNMRSWYTGFQIKSCADNITNTLIAARMNAIKNGNNQVVFFYTANNCPSSIAGIDTNSSGMNCYFTLNDTNNECQTASSSCFEAGEFNGAINTCSSNIAFPATIIAKSGGNFTVPTDYCAVTGLSVTPCAIPNSCTFCSGYVGAIAYLPDGQAQFLGAGGVNSLGGSVTVIPSADAANNNSLNEFAIGIIGPTGAVKEFH